MNSLRRSSQYTDEAATILTPSLQTRKLTSLKELVQGHAGRAWPHSNVGTQLLDARGQTAPGDAGQDGWWQDPRWPGCHLHMELVILCGAGEERMVRGGAFGPRHRSLSSEPLGSLLIRCPCPKYLPAEGYIVPLQPWL